MENVDSIGPASKGLVASLLRMERDSSLPRRPISEPVDVHIDPADFVEIGDEEAARLAARRVTTVTLMTLPTGRRRGPAYLVIISADGLGRGWNAYDLRRRRSAHPGALLDVLGLDDEPSEPEDVEVGEEPRRAPPPLHLRALITSTFTAAPPAAPAVLVHAGAST